MWASLEAGRKRTLGAGGRNTRGGRKCCDKVALWPTVLFVLLTVHSGCFAAAPSEMELYPPMGATDTVITLNGAHFPTSSTVYCRSAQHAGRVSDTRRRHRPYHQPALMSLSFPSSRPLNPGP